jgi:hypothetical protein
MQVPFTILAARMALAACLVVGAYECLLFARAAYLYQEDTATSVPAAVALVPFDGAYQSRLAAWQPQRKQELLNKAVALNPFDVEALMQLGLTAELQDGDVKAAERYYLRAAEVDKMFRPRWTLTNFYFRQQKPAEFFRWARATLEITPYPAEPVFAQMWLESQDTARLAAVIPDRPSILLQYALYLPKEKQFSALPAIVQRLTAHVDARDAHGYGRDDVIGPLEDRLLLAGENDSALAVWNTMVEAHWLPYDPPTASDPLTNGDFHNPFFQHGFDWAVANPNGVSITQIPQDGSVRLTFSSDQGEHVPLLRQFLPLQPGANYRLEWRAETDGVTSPSGLNWRIYPLEKNSGPDLQSGDLLSSSAGKWQFQADATARYAMLTLEYIRPLGSTRAAGQVTIRAVSLKENDTSHEK